MPEMSGVLPGSTSVNTIDASEFFSSDEVLKNYRMENLSSKISSKGTNGGEKSLKLFGQAKKKINNLFNCLHDFLENSTNFVEKLSLSDLDIIAKELLNDVAEDSSDDYYFSTSTTRLADFKGIIKSISKVVVRDRMKVVFFGRTSNGKSTAINAMLNDKVLPSGIGHTTSCFIQVEGVDSEEPCLIVEGDSEPRNVDGVAHLASALSNIKLSESSLIRILWPKRRCMLLREDVVILDSPGIDLSAETDEWIDKFCLDADVFVLVANAESTLMRTEKTFFHNVNKRLSKPNVFILNNRWDASSGDENAEQVRQQHISRIADFLYDELHVIDSRDVVSDRVFFVSAKEVLSLRHSGGLSSPMVFRDGNEGRTLEFERFEREFSHCISHSAVTTKFSQHVSKARVVISDTLAIMNDIFERTTNTAQLLKKDVTDKKEHISLIDSEKESLSNDIKTTINTLSVKVEHTVSQALSSEIQRLSVLVGEYDRPFHSDAMVLRHYKKELHAYVEETLGRNLEASCSALLTEQVLEVKSKMLSRISGLIPEDTVMELRDVAQQDNFKIIFRIDCRNMCADFKEDIGFKFSLGISALVRRFLPTAQADRILRVRSSPDSIPRSPSANTIPTADITEVEALGLLFTTYSSLTSKTTVSSIALTGVAIRTLGWRIFAVAIGIYSSIYIYERFMWTQKAKERTFKRQYVDYASQRLKWIVDLTSSNCSHQVQQELTHLFGVFQKGLESYRMLLVEDSDILNQNLAVATQAFHEAKALTNTASLIDVDFEAFASDFLAKA